MAVAADPAGGGGLLPGERGGGEDGGVLVPGLSRPAPPPLHGGPGGRGRRREAGRPGRSGGQLRPLLLHHVNMEVKKSSEL